MCFLSEIRSNESFTGISLPMDIVTLGPLSRTFA